MPLVAPNNNNNYNNDRNTKLTLQDNFLFLCISMLYFVSLLSNKNQNYNKTLKHKVNAFYQITLTNILL